MATTSVRRYSKIPDVGWYRVQRRDSLWKIADIAYGRGEWWEQIAEWNNMKRGQPLLVGQVILIPMPRQGLHHLHPSFAHASDPAAHHLGLAHPSHFTAHHDPYDPHGAMLHQNHVSTRSLNETTKTGPFQEARPVLFPAFKYELEGVVLEQITPNFDTKLSFKGEVTLQKQGVITAGLTFTKEGIEAEYKREADGVFKDLFSKSSVKYAGSNAELSFAVGSQLKSGTQVLASSEFAIVPPNTTKYTCKGREVKGVFSEYEFGGLIGYEFEVHFKPSRPSQTGVVHVTSWARIAGITLVAGAAVIVIVDVGKDIGTLGVGTVESPLSWAAAAEMFGRGVTMTRGVSQ